MTAPDLPGRQREAEAARQAMFETLMCPTCGLGQPGLVDRGSEEYWRRVDAYGLAMRRLGAAEALTERTVADDEDDEKVRDFLDRGAVVLCVNENGDVGVWEYGPFVDDPNSKPLAADGSPLTALYCAAIREAADA